MEERHHARHKEKPSKFVKYIRHFSGQNRIFLFLQIAICIWVWHLWKNLPSPGWAVAILAGVAAAMSVHGDMRGWQKAVWMLLIGCLLVIELRAISKDRFESNQKALQDRKEQDAAFKSVRDLQDTEFKATALGLETAISGIKSTLQAADTTLIQTRPQAAIRFDRLQFSDTTPPSEIKSDVPYSFNYYYVNGGRLTAANIDIMAKLYVAAMDSKDEQTKLAKEFNDDWHKGDEKKKSQGVLVPDYPSFGSMERSFTNDEVQKLSLKGPTTIYYLLRFEYSDNTGRWRTDVCGSFQKRDQLETNIFHTCSVFQKFHYAVKAAH